MLAIIDYDAGNLRSVAKALEKLGETPVITRNPAEILSADHIILPGVGSFGDAMNRLHQYGLVDVIRKASASHIPFLGICLGLQLLFASSEETPGVEGLGICSGKILRIPDTEGLKIPHMGWNKLELRSPSPLLEGAEGEYVYFVHSFHAEPEDRSIITSVCDYGMEVTASVGRGNVQAFQFHPEKSSRVGMRLLKNFVEL